MIPRPGQSHVRRESLTQPLFKERIVMKIIEALLGGVHRGEQGRVAWGPTFRYWWAIFFPSWGEVSGRALTPAERENRRPR